MVLNCKIINKFFLKPPTSIAVAVSGGADSLFLTYIAKQWCEKHSVKLYALIVDHKLRPESSKEAILVSKLLKDQGIENAILIWEGRKPKTNVHHHARQKRYELLTKYCKSHDIEHLLVAHTLTDQAETVLLRILRGSGVDGIAGIPVHNEINHVRILRPLLEVRREEIESTLLKVGWQWVNDPSNVNMRYERSKVRKLINSFEDKDTLVKRLTLLAYNARRTRNFLEKYTVDVISRYVKFPPLACAAINKGEFVILEEEIALRVLNILLKKIGGKIYPARLESLLTLFKNLQKENFKAHTLQGVQIRNHHDQILLYREPLLITSSKSIKKNKEICWDNRFLIVANIDGKIGPLGKEGYASIKKYLINFQKPPFIEMIYSLPTIYDKNGTILAVPHLRYFLKNVKVNLTECHEVANQLFA